MENSKIRTELRQYREQERLTVKQMSEQFNLSEYDYSRIESGAVKPIPEEERKYRNLLEQYRLGPSTPRKWYQSKKWRWVIPIVISWVFYYLLWSSAEFHEGYGAERFETNPPIKSSIIFSVVFCAIYWYYWTPEWPFKKTRKLF